MKVVIIGCGNVGMSYAYSLVNQPTRVDELVLIDVNKNIAEGNALDLNHALSFAPSRLKIKAGDYIDCNNAHIICISAGKNQNPGESRMDLINKNLIVFKDIIGQIKQTNFNGIYLIATNPVDVMSYITYKLTGNSNKVIGSGTTLDTARLKFLISQHLKINSSNIHAYVLGEHGDSEMIPWSKATVGLKDIKDYLSQKTMDNLLQEVRNSAYEIIEKKGNTCYGIGVCLHKITNAILSNDNSILTLSVYNKQHDIYISVPTIVNRSGVHATISVDFSKEEEEEFAASINFLKQIATSIKI